MSTILPQTKIMEVVEFILTQNILLSDDLIALLDKIITENLYPNDITENKSLEIGNVTRKINKHLMPLLEEYIDHEKKHDFINCLKSNSCSIDVNDLLSVKYKKVLPLNKRPKLVLIRGLPGAGKTTYAKNKFADYIYYDADMYFIKGDGIYYFEYDLLRHAHNWCYKRMMENIMLVKNVVIANTFSTTREIYSYYNENNKDIVNLKVICLTTQFKSVHNVPEEKIQQMKKRWQKYPSEILI